MVNIKHINYSKFTQFIDISIKTQGRTVTLHMNHFNMNFTQEHIVV